MSTSFDSGPEKIKNALKPEADEKPLILQFSSSEEATLLEESNTQKANANTLFGSGDYSSAIQGYLKALSSCPVYFGYDVAVLHSNIAACHLKLRDWKATASAATEALESLDQLDPPAENQRPGEETHAQVEEVNEKTAVKIDALARSGRNRDDIQKIRTKALLRRAKARKEIGGWAALQGSEEDYRRLSAMPNLSPLDHKIVQNALRLLPQRLEEAKQKEMGEMVGKLKQLGNGILKPFGLSTDNFNFVKDETSGGYSMQFNQNT
ncbi:hypothetical protein AOQ84DRAFT_396811 [Glonium stellatum]|uniref:Tetratricopeptide repeat protein 1 n=1 Tax=Glonium stellatum TaxID=574774 RepID=A0A8E2JUU7_9PEZI|nr:hypothetical protein AOQ84DRAFT_396811 [Glonium stellatum]